MKRCWLWEREHNVKIYADCQCTSYDADDADNNFQAKLRILNQIGVHELFADGKHITLYEH